MKHHPEIPPNGEWFFRRILGNSVAYPNRNYYFFQGYQMDTIIVDGACPNEKYVIASVAVRLWKDCAFSHDVAKLYVPEIYHDKLIDSWEHVRNHHIRRWEEWGSVRAREGGEE